MNYQKLFDYMLNEHGVTLLEQDMIEVCSIANELQEQEVGMKTLAFNSYKQGFKDAVDALQAANESVQKTQLP